MDKFISSTIAQHPSFPLAVTGVVIYSALACYHVCVYFQHKTWFFYLMLLGAIMEAVGMVVRAFWAGNPDKTNLAYIAFVLAFLAPSLLAAASQRTFARIIWYSSAPNHQSTRYLLIPAKWMTSIFLTFNLAGFVPQAVGMILLRKATDNTRIDYALHVIKISLIIQLAWLAIFTTFAIRYLLTSQHWTDDNSKLLRFTSRKLAWTVYTTSMLFIIRTIYRLAQISAMQSKTNNYILSHRWPGIVAETIPVLLILLSFATIHPGRTLPQTFTRFRIDQKAVEAFRRSGKGGFQSTWPRPTLQHVGTLPLPYEKRDLSSSHGNPQRTMALYSFDKEKRCDSPDSIV